MNDALDGVQSFLVSKLNAALVVIETAKSITIPRLEAVDTAPILSRVFPQMEILPEVTDTLYRDDEGPLDFEAFDVHTVTLLLSITGSDVKAVEYNLTYYRLAIMRIIKADNTFGGLFNRVRLGQSKYWPAAPNEAATQFLQTLRQTLLVRVLQT
jgi:hypothetical protein